jgi:hypothetical protein
MEGGEDIGEGEVLTLNAKEGWELREDGEGNWGKIEKVDDIFSVWANRRCSE